MISAQKVVEYALPLTTSVTQQQKDLLRSPFSSPRKKAIMGIDRIDYTDPEGLDSQS
jgi:hypothetical protein